MKLDSNILDELILEALGRINEDDNSIGVISFTMKEKIKEAEKICSEHCYY